MNVNVLIAAHKPYNFLGVTQADSIYHPIVVGHALSHLNLKDAYFDDEGENISAKNRRYNEMTAIYWAWKHLGNQDAIGLVHYRRYFSGNSKEGILTESEIKDLLSRTPVILPKKRHYVIETNRSQYAHAHFSKDLDTMRDILNDFDSEDVLIFDKVMQKRSGHRLNMFIMQADYFDDYCSWIFPRLAEFEQRVDLSGYDTYQTRVTGFVAERLMDVWLMKNSVNYSEVKVTTLEKDNLFRKAVTFLLRKVGIRVYA